MRKTLRITAHFAAVAAIASATLLAAWAGFSCTAVSPEGNADRGPAQHLRFAPTTKSQQHDSPVIQGAMSMGAALVATLYHSNQDASNFVLVANSRKSFVTQMTVTVCADSGNIAIIANSSLAMAPKQSPPTYLDCVFTENFKRSDNRAVMMTVRASTSGRFFVG